MYSLRVCFPRWSCASSTLSFFLRRVKFTLVVMVREDVLDMEMNRHIWWDLFALLCVLYCHSHYYLFIYFKLCFCLRFPV